jgi:hypothetical protein
MTPESARSRKALLNGRAPFPVVNSEDRLLTVAQAAGFSGVDAVFIRKAARGRQLRLVMCIVSAYALIQGAIVWLHEKAAEFKTGKTTIWGVIAMAIGFIIVAWFLGSAGMRFISQ